MQHTDLYAAYRLAFASKQSVDVSGFCFRWVDDAQDREIQGH
jgi:hypothetical protein